MKQDQSKNMKPWAITSAFFPAHKDTMLLLLSSSAELQQQADPLPVPRQLER
jgi:hypothetical protein